MTANHTNATDPTGAWETSIRSAVIHELDAARVSMLANTLASGVVVATAGAASLIAAGGGASMTTAMIAGTATTHTAAKVAAWSLAAALTAGGAAAATGQLPAPAQSFAADAAAHVGIGLPRPGAALEVGGSADVSIAKTISLGAAGSVGVVLDDDGLQLTSLDANSGFSASVLAETADEIIVQFESAEGTSSVLVSNVDGAVTAAVTGETATTDGGASGDASVQTGGEADLATDGSSTSIEGSVDAEVEVTLGG